MTNPQTTLTPKQHAAWQLHQQGMSERNIALHLRLSRSAVQARLENARRKLAEEEPAP